MKLLLAAIVALAFSVGALAQDPPAVPAAGGDAVKTDDAKPAAPAKADKKGKKKHAKKKAPKDS